MHSLRALAAAAFFLSSTAALAQVEVRVGLPSIRFELPPPLVIVTPGVQVVEDYGHEVFFVDGHYWHRDGDRWYRARDHRGGWVVVERRIVPVQLVELRAGKYKHYKHAKYEKGGHDKHGPGKHAHKAKGGKGHGKGKGKD